MDLNIMSAYLTKADVPVVVPLTISVPRVRCFFTRAEYPHRAPKLACSQGLAKALCHTVLMSWYVSKCSSLFIVFPQCDSYVLSILKY